jgi:hypothetical protein
MAIQRGQIYNQKQQQTLEKTRHSPFGTINTTENLRQASPFMNSNRLSAIFHV